VYDPDSEHFKLGWLNNPALGGGTVVYLPWPENECTVEIMPEDIQAEWHDSLLVLEAEDYSGTVELEVQRLVE
jgi:hypothetical protein